MFNESIDAVRKEDVAKFKSKVLSLISEQQALCELEHDIDTAFMLVILGKKVQELN